MNRSVKHLFLALLLLPGMIYAQNQPISFEGYGELHLEHPNQAGKEQERTLNLKRLVFGFEYSFQEDLFLNAEFEFEDAGNELEVEFAYVEKLLPQVEGLSFRGGLLLMPVGFLNEAHEPTNFPYVRRPQFEKLVVPTTWMEPGAGLVLERNKFNLRAYLVGGLDGEKFRKVDGIRKGRGKGKEQKASDFGFVSRVEYKPILGLTIGSTFYHAGASQGNPQLAGVDATLYEADAVAQWQGFKLSSAFSFIDVDNADRIQTLADDNKTCDPDKNATGDLSSCPDPGSAIQGWYTALSYDLPLGGEKRLVPFIKFERVDTHNSVPNNVIKDAGADRKILNFGLAFFETDQLAYKWDIELWDFGDGKNLTQWNAALAFRY